MPIYDKVDTIVALGAAIRAALVAGAQVIPATWVKTLSGTDTPSRSAGEALHAPAHEGSVGFLASFADSADPVRTNELFPNPPQASPEDVIAFARSMLLSKAEPGSRDVRLMASLREILDANNNDPDAKDRADRLLRYIAMHDPAYQSNIPGSDSSPTGERVREAPERISGRLKIGGKLGYYQIKGELGHGSYSSVYLAEDTTSSVSRVVALKVPMRQHVSESWLWRVLHEAKIWRALCMHGHPNILALDDVQRDGPITFFVTEYMDGSDVATCLSNAGPWPIAKVVDLIEQISAGLAFAHQERVLHRDIKPQNVLLSADQLRIKLGDFGLSTFVSESAPGGNRVLGSPLFMAPEAFDGVASKSTDIYALGVTMYFMLTQRYPFVDAPAERDDYSQLISRKKAFVCDIRTLRQDVPSWLNAIVSRCLTANAADRFADACELHEQLSYFVNPATRERVILMAWPNPGEQTLDYDVEVAESHFKDLLSVQINHPTIKAIAREWDRLGELALVRAELRMERVGTSAIDAEIQASLKALSDDAAHMLLGSRVRGLLDGSTARTLWLRHDPRLTAVPWELLRARGTFVCRGFDLARWPRLVRSRSTHAAIGYGQPIRVLIIGDTTGDLPESHVEAVELERVLSQSPLAGRMTIEVLGAEADSFKLRSKMRHCDVIHYAGHAVFSSEDLSSSGWLFKDDPDSHGIDDLLSARSLEDFWSERAPVLVFANACSSARSTTDMWQSRAYSDAAVGLGQAFLAAGASNYIGAVWDPPDTEATVAFALSFYRHFFDGLPIGESMRAARDRCAGDFGEEELTWARYVLMGDPLTHFAI
jgi:serine/threonine protein kinase/CHAT domain-containing protein